MMQITQESIYSRFPWAKSISEGVEDFGEGHFHDVPVWSFNQLQLNLIYTMLEEVESWYQRHDKPCEIIIIEFKDVQGHVFVEKICGFSEVSDIFEKYSAVCIDGCHCSVSPSGKAESESREENDYDDIF